MGSWSHFLTIGVILLFFTAACSRGKPKEQLLFYYYPDKNIYYEPVKKEFWYSLNGAKSWKTFTNANNGEPVALGEKVVIYSSNTDVYKDNENHRKQYAGRLYAIIADSATSSVAPEVSERKVMQKRRSAGTKKTVNNKPKNSFGKFIDKIFGKP